MIMLEKFWMYMIERENIRLRRLVGLPREKWTDDPTMKSARFTNVKREHDRVSVLLKKELYDPNVVDGETLRETILVNAAVFRYFGTIDAARTIGWTKTWNDEASQRLISLGDAGKLKFTSAYIIPNCGLSEPKHRIVARIVNGISSIAGTVVMEPRWEIACHLLSRLFGVGSFMAKEVYLDLVMATGQTPDDWQTWTPIGPGGLRGAAWVSDGRQSDISHSEALEVIRAVYATREKFWPKKFVIEENGQPIYMAKAVELDLTDIQFQFCEFDKYNRISLRGARSKRSFKPIVDGVTRSGR